MQKEEVRCQVQKLLENGLIEMSTSAYNSPLIIVPKKSLNGKTQFRMCVDFRKLNKKLIADKFPLPRIEEILEGLGKAKYFSVLDLQSGYHQIPLNEKSRHLTAFSTDTGFYQWKVLPFGLNVAPSSFSRMMTMAFAGLKPQRAFIYMDDLLVVGSTESQHLKNLFDVFETCRRVNLKVNPGKCEFLRNEVYFLGHKCTQKGLLPDERKISAVKNYERPKDKDAVKRFVAFANYYRRFVRNFAEIARPLSALTRKCVDFIWGEECERSFQKLKDSLISTEILAYPDFEQEFRVTVDASQWACGAVLSQLIQTDPIHFKDIQTWRKKQTNN